MFPVGSGERAAGSAGVCPGRVREVRLIGVHQPVLAERGELD